MPLYVNPLASLPIGRTEQILESGTSEKVALQELEQFFVYTLLEEMRKTIPEDSLLGGGFVEEIHQSLLDDAYSKEIAKSGQLGIADSIAEQLRIQEMQASIRARFAAGQSLKL